MRMRSASSPHSFFAILFLAGLAAPLSAQLKVTFGTTSLSVTGSSPRRPVIVYSVAQVPSNGNAHIVEQRFHDAADANGSVTIDLKESVPFQSFWLVADLTAGSYTVAVPPGFIPDKIEISPPQRGRDSDVISVHRPFVFLCMVRPGVGAWDKHVTDGQDDADGIANGNAAIGLDHLTPIDIGLPAPALKRLAARDILFVVDPLSMRYGIVQAAGGTDAH